MGVKSFFTFNRLVGGCIAVASGGVGLTTGLLTHSCPETKKAEPVEHPVLTDYDGSAIPLELMEKDLQRWRSNYERIVKEKNEVDRQVQCIVNSIKRAREKSTWWTTYSVSEETVRDCAPWLKKK